MLAEGPQHRPLGADLAPAVLAALGQAVGHLLADRVRVAVVAAARGSRPAGQARKALIEEVKA